MNQMMSPEQFIDAFAPALQDYLEYQYRKEGHILDMAAASGEFFTVSYHSISAAIGALQYTNPVAPKGKTTSKK